MSVANIATGVIYDYKKEEYSIAFTYFFRDLQTLELLRDHVIPVMRTRRFIHVWDAGCAMGPEPYTISIILREGMGKMIFRNLEIHGTDMDGSNLFGDIIEKGVYPREQVERIPKDLFNKYFQPADEPDSYVLTEEIRKSVSFLKHDLLSLKPPRKDFLLIVCKNVLLHFTEKQRIEVIKMYHDSLVEGGFFVMEQTQKMPKQVEHLFEPMVANAQLYKKIG